MKVLIRTPSYLLAFDWMTPDRRSVGFMLGYPAFSPFSSRVSFGSAPFSSLRFFEAAVAVAGLFSCLFGLYAMCALGPTSSLLRCGGFGFYAMCAGVPYPFLYLPIIKHVPKKCHKFQNSDIYNAAFSASTFLLFPEAPPLSICQLLLRVRLGVG